jgi:hypothetical protein
MNLDSISNPTRKTIVRQKKAYEERDLDGAVSTPLPFDTNDFNADALEAKGFSIGGLVRQMNQVFLENVGNNWGAVIRKAIKNGTPLPSQAEFDKIVCAYDFTGVRRASTSDDDLSEEERIFLSELRKQLKLALRAGSFSTAEPRVAMTVQTKKEAETDTCPENKMTLEDFDSLVAAAAEKAVFDYDGRRYDFSVAPEFDEAGNFVNWGALVSHAEYLTGEQLKVNAAKVREIRVMPSSLIPPAATA